MQRQVLLEFENRLKTLVSKVATSECYDQADIQRLLSECETEGDWIRGTFESELKPCYLANRFRLPILECQPFALERSDAITLALSFISFRESALRAALSPMFEAADDALDNLLFEGFQAWKDVRNLLQEIGRAISLLANPATITPTKSLNIMDAALCTNIREAWAHATTFINGVQSKASIDPDQALYESRLAIGRLAYIKSNLEPFASAGDEQSIREWDWFLNDQLGAMIRKLEMIRDRFGMASRMTIDPKTRMALDWIALNWVSIAQNLHRLTETSLPLVDSGSTVSETINGAKGVSAFDLGLAIEGEAEPARGWARRFSSDATLEALGKCPIDGRAQIYDLAEMLTEFERMYGLDKRLRAKIVKELSLKLRFPVSRNLPKS